VNVTLFRLGSAIGILLGSLLSAASAAAKPKTHDGFQLRFSGGVGLLAMSRSVDTEVAGNTESEQSELGGLGESAEVLFGGTPARGLVIGGGLYVVNAVKPKLDRATSNDVDLIRDLTFVHAGALVDWYPDPHAGLHFGGLVGVSGAVGEAPGTRSLTERVGGVGPCLALHLGYDFWLGREWSLGPELRTFVASTRDTRQESSFTAQEQSWLYGSSLLLSAAYH
jgi:hypothetical protein